MNMSRQELINKRYQIELKQKDDSIRLLNDQMRQFNEINNKTGLNISIRNKSEYCCCSLFFEYLY